MRTGLKGFILSWLGFAFYFADPPRPNERPGERDPEVMGSYDVVRSRINAQLPEVRWSSESQGMYFGDGFSIEIALHALEAGLVSAVAFNLHGGGDPFPDLLRVTEPNGWYLMDTGHGQWIRGDNPCKGGWYAYQSLRSIRPLE